LLTHLTVC